MANKEKMVNLNEEVLSRINQVKMDVYMTEFDGDDDAFESLYVEDTKDNAAPPIVSRSDLLLQRTSSNSSIGNSLDRQQQKFRRSTSKESLPFDNSQPTTPERISSHVSNISESSPKLYSTDKTTDISGFRRSYVKK